MTTTNKTQTAFMYLRVSTPSQQIEEQVRENTSFAERHGIEIIGRYGDYGKRHHASKRQSFQAMLDDVQLKKPDMVLVQRLDRFGTQDSDELGYFNTILKRQRVKLITTIDGMEITKGDLQTSLLNCIKAGQSRQEQIDKAERVLTGKRKTILAGEYIGTKYLPFATDLICIGRDGSEKWRLVEESYDLRIKYLPSETGEYQEAERYQNEILKDTLGIMRDKLIRYRPTKEAGEHLFYSPSIRGERIELLKRMFEMFANGWTTYAIAEQFNRENIKPMFQDRWYSSLIDGILANPVYVGKPAFNRTTQASFRVIKSGVFQPIEERRYAEQEKADWLQCGDQIFTPMVDEELFNEVQEKLEERRTSTPKRQPKCETLWFGGLWEDEESGYKLAGNCREKILKPKDARHHGKRISFQQAEQLIGRYLDETGQRLDVIGEAVESRRVLQKLTTAEWMTELKLEFIVQEIEAYISTKLGQGRHLVDGIQVIVDVDNSGETTIEAVGDLWRVYATMINEDMQHDTNKMVELKGERDRLLKEMISLKNKSPVILEAYAEQVEILNQAIANVGRIFDWREWCEQVRSEVQQIRTQQEQVKKMLQRTEHTGKATAIRSLVDKIICRFEETPTTDKRHRNGVKYRLVHCVFYPTNGGENVKMMPVETPLG